MDRLLEHAKSLYADRQRVALAAMMIAFSVTLYLFYSPGIYAIPAEPPIQLPPGWVQGFEIVYSFNTVGFFLAFAVMVFMYAFWSWAFLPTPAVNYTSAVLRGIFGPRSPIAQSIGKRFRVVLNEKTWIDLTCHIKEQGSGAWFVYKLTSSPLRTSHLEEIALRHGFGTKDGRLTTWVSSDELHSRSILLAKAMALAASSA